MQASFTTSGEGQRETESQLPYKDARFEDDSSMYDVLELAEDFSLVLDKIHGESDHEDAPFEDGSAIYDVLKFAEDLGLFLEKTNARIVFNKDF